MCRSGERCTVRAHAFLRLPPPRWAFSSPGPCPHQGSFPQKSGCHDHIPSFSTTCGTAATSPRRIPRHSGPRVIQAAGHTVIGGGTLGVCRDVQGARDGGLSVPHRRRPVCAIAPLPCPICKSTNVNRTKCTGSVTIWFIWCQSSHVLCEPPFKPLPAQSIVYQSA